MAVDVWSDFPDFPLPQGSPLPNLEMMFDYQLGQIDYLNIQTVGFSKIGTAVDPNGNRRDERKALGPGGFF